MARFLLAHDARVHEHRAAAAELGGEIGAERGGGDIGRVYAQRRREVLEERSASRRASLVDRDVGYDAAVEPDGLHVLPADVQDEVRIRFDGAGRGRVRDGFDRVAVGMVGMLEQRLAIPRRAAGDDIEPDARLGIPVAQRHERIGADAERLALIGRIEFIDQALALIDEREFRGGGSRIDAQIGAHRAPDVVRHVACTHDFGKAMPRVEGVALLERLEELRARRRRRAAPHARQHVFGPIDVKRFGRVGEKPRA